MLKDMLYVLDEKMLRVEFVDFETAYDCGKECFLDYGTLKRELGECWIEELSADNDIVVIRIDKDCQDFEDEMGL